MRPKVAALLLGLPLLFALAAPAAAQTVSFSTGNYPVWEGDSAQVEVVLSESRRTDTTVELVPIAISATGFGVDFIDSSRPTVTIPRYETRGTGTIRTVEDAKKEVTEQFRLDILPSSLPAGVTLGARSTAYVDIQDDDQDAGSLPRLSIARYGKYVPGQSGGFYAPVVEGTAASFSVVVSTDWAAPKELTVTLEVSEETGEGQNFVAPGNEGAQTMTIHPWRDGAAKIYQVPTANDGSRWADGAVTVRLVPSDDYHVEVGRHWATVEVVDDDHPRGLILESSTPMFGGLTMPEGGGGGYTVRLASPPTGDVTVAWTRRDDGDGDGDWSNVHISPASMTFTQDNWFETQLMTVRGDRDNDGDNDRFSVLHTASGGGYGGISDFMRVGVVDNYPGDDREGFSSQDGDEDFQSDNTPPAACVSDAQWSTVAGYYDSNANRSPNYGANWYRVLIAYRLARPDLALPDWEGATARPTAAYTVKEAEDGEAVWSGWTPVREVLECLAAGITAQAVPVPDPELSLSAGPAVDEGAGAAFTVHADPAPQSDLTVSVSVAQTGDYLASPGAGTRTLTLPAGTSSASLIVATANDATDEPDGSVSVSLNAGTGYTVASSNASATVAVRDDDDPVPEVSISAGGDVTEGAAASFTVTASPAPASALDVAVTVAQSGDFAASGATGSRTVTIPSSGSATLTVATEDDGTDESDGSVSAAINAGAGYSVSSPNGAATVAVRDNDDPPAATTCVSGSQWKTVEGYYKSNAGKAPNYGANWYRVLIAYRSEHTHRALPAWTGPTAAPTAAFTVGEAEDGEKAWSGWTPVRKALECLRDANRIGRSFVPLLPGSAHPAQEGVVRIVNRSPRAGTVRIAATDDAGWRPEPVALRIGPGGSVELTTGDLERGNAAKGLDGAIGTGTGDWRLDVSSDLDLGVRPFARAADGATAAMHGVAEETDGVHAVWTFNPADGLQQTSLLRVINLGAEPATARITGIDDAGLPGGAVALELPARASVQLTAADLEGGGPGIDGRLGDGRGRWRLRVASAGELAVMNLAVSPFGHLTNLSGGGFPALRGGRAHPVPHFPPASDGLGRLGLVRVVNESARGGEVRVLAHDAAGRRHGPLTLRLGPGGAAQFDSWDLEFGGAAGGGLTGSTGPGVGAWRLEVTSGLDIRVRAYVATPDGSLRTAREFAAGPGPLREWEAFEEDR